MSVSRLKFIYFVQQLKGKRINNVVQKGLD